MGSSMMDGGALASFFGASYLSDEGDEETSALPNDPLFGDHDTSGESSDTGLFGDRSGATPNFFADVPVLGFSSGTSGSASDDGQEPSASGAGLFGTSNAFFQSRLFGNPFGGEASASSDEPFRSRPEGFITQQKLDELSEDPEKVAKLKDDIAKTPMFLYHGFTDVGGVRGDIPYLDRAGFDVDITNFEADLRSVLDRGGELVTTRDIVEKNLRGEPVPDNWHIVRIDDGDQTTALAVDVVKKLKAEYPEGTKIKLELGINAGTVGSPGTEKAGSFGDVAAGEPGSVYGTDEEIKAFARNEEGYDAPTTDNAHVTYRKVTWGELADWVENDYVEVSNHGLNHLVHASQETIDEKNTDSDPKNDIDTAFLENGGQLSEATVRREIGTDETVGSGEELLERELSARLPENYEVTTFIWPRGDFDNPHSTGAGLGDDENSAFEDSGHVVGLGTGKQNSSSIKSGKFESPYGDSTYYGELVEPVGNEENPGAEWDIFGLPVITINTDD